MDIFINVQNRNLRISLGVKIFQKPALLENGLKYTFIIKNVVIITFFIIKNVVFFDIWQ